MLGPHVILSSEAAKKWARAAPIVKALDRVDVLEAAPDNAVRVFRHFLHNQNTADPVGTANAVLAALGGYRHPNLYVELWNEAHPTADQLTAAVKVCHANAVKVAGGSWGTGDYVASDWAAARTSDVDAIAVHCYWGNQGLTTFHALRYRQFWQPGDPPVVITECGRDAVEGGGRGWQKSGITAAQYVKELLSYAHELAKDAFVIGATPFSAGPSPTWSDFSTDDIVDDLLKEKVIGIMPDTTAAEPTIAQLLARIKGLEVQNAILTATWKAFRQGKFTGADGIDGLIVEMQGGQPLGFEPNYPPKG